MTYLPTGLDRTAASAARRLLGWASGRRSSSDGTWIHALSAEVDEIDAGWDQLAWALGVLPLVLVERGAAIGRTWRPRLLWLASAGGLGALRVYGPGVVAGVLMLVWSYRHRDMEVAAPFFAVVVFAPFYVLRGLLAARRRSDDAAAAIGAVTAVVGFAVGMLGTAVYVGVRVPGMVWVAFPVAGLGFALVVAAIGAACGLLGAALAHPGTTIRSIRSRRR